MNREFQTAIESKPANEPTAETPPADVPSADAPPAAESSAPAEETVAQDNAAPRPVEPEIAGAPQPKAGGGA